MDGPSHPARVLCVVGTRPEVVKMAPVVRAFQQTDWAEPRLVSTGQHRELMRPALQLFGFRPDIELGLMHPGQTLAELTARSLAALDDVLAHERPDFVLAQGDTTTVLATALACFYRGTPLGHVEAGLRTGNLQAPFPEEMNRKLTAPLARLHFAPTVSAQRQLLAEGIPRDRVFLTGNTVVDALHQVIQSGLPPIPDWAGGRPLIAVTAHRRENHGPPLADICQAIRKIASLRDVAVVFPVHPNPQVRQSVESLLGGTPRIQLVEPLDYGQFLALLKAARLILTDSGGVQEEAPVLGKPVLVLREFTERPEGIDSGNALLVGTNPERIVEQVLRLLDDPIAYSNMARATHPYGDGKAAARIVSHVGHFLGHRSEPAFDEPLPVAVG